jgi:hypothetical protein
VIQAKIVGFGFVFGHNRAGWRHLKKEVEAVSAYSHIMLGSDLRGTFPQ